MTLITKTTTAFTDTSLPILQKDPVLPNVGGVVLFDFKNVGTWSSQSSPVTTFTSLTNNSWPVLSASNASNTYSPSTGRVTATGNTDLSLETSGSRLFADLTANYCFSLWIYVPTAFSFYETYLSKGTGSNTNADRTLTVRGGSGNRLLEISRSGGSDLFSYTAPAAGVYRLGYAWSKNSGTWQYKTCVNQSENNWQTSASGTGANGVYENTANNGVLFGSAGGAAPTGLGVYRFYLENLTLSGRTASQVWAADWERGNGRYS